MATSSNTRSVNDDTPGINSLSPAIVVAAYNRPASLLRLLNGLLKAHYPAHPVPLHISIDQSFAPDVAQTAEDFAWPYGPKKVEKHPEHLGLRSHLLHCGDLSQEYGSIVLLEDDLYISPEFYRFASQALNQYRPDTKIAGVSLYHYESAESSQLPFRPLEDGQDLYFMQWPSSWGLAVEGTQWASFRAWIKDQDWEKGLDQWLPEFVQAWEIGSWKRLFIAYLRAQDLYFVYPRVSLSTHFGEPGPHTILKGFQQSPLLSQEKNWQWIGLEDSLAVYDAWFELLPDRVKSLQPSLAEFDFSVDLYGMKEVAALGEEFVLTSRWVSAELQENSALVPRKYAMELLPVVQNIIAGLEGYDLFLVQREALDKRPSSLQHYISKLPGWSRSLVEKGVSGDLLRISVVVPESSHSPEAEATIASILKQERAQIEVIALVRGELEPSPDDRVRALAWPEGMGYWEALETGMRAASGEVLIWMHPGVTLQAGVLEQLEAILQQYREVNWLLMRPSVGTVVPQQRWTQDRFARVSSEAVADAFGPGTSVFRRGFWQSLGSGIRGGEELARKAFAKGLPYAVDLVGPASNNPKDLVWGPSDPQRSDLKAKRTLPGRILSRMARPFFLKNGTLRWVHAEMEHYPPVIRFDTELNRWDMQRF